MKRMMPMLALLLAFCDPALAVRVLEDVENSFELTLREVELPAGAASSVSFRACSTCRTSVHRVTVNTEYFVDGARVTLEDFLRTAADIRAVRAADERTFIGVYFDLASTEVTRIALQRPR